MRIYLAASSLLLLSSSLAMGHGRDQLQQRARAAFALLAPLDHNEARAQDVQRQEVINKRPRLEPRGSMIEGATPPSGRSSKRSRPHPPQVPTGPENASRMVSANSPTEAPQRQSAKAEPRAVSVGKPWSGRLVDGMRLTASHGYTVREGQNFGTQTLSETIRHAIAAVHIVHPGSPALHVGDLSLSGGGPMRSHRSHQSGRDADLGFYLKEGHNPRRFKGATTKNLDVPRTWTLLKALVDSGKTQLIFVDYTLQRALYRHARSQGLTPDQLAPILAYPQGKRSKRSIIRHWSGHRDHLHLRVVP